MYENTPKELMKQYAKQDVEATMELHKVLYPPKKTFLQRIISFIKNLFDI